jgi:serine/threonine protein phosphatase PrpC
MNAPAPMAPAATQPIGLRLEGAMLSDVGCVRPHNEDAVAFVIPSQGATTDSQDSLALLADGMGGHAAGEVASALAAEEIRRVFYERKGGRPEETLAAAFAAANGAILDYAQNHPECAGMGTTCTALAICGDTVWLAHVGDSRAYLLRGSKLQQLSEDQTLVAKLVREGVLTAEEAINSEHSNVILQALGTTPKIAPDIWSEGLPLWSGDTLILCSDGLYNLVPDAKIAEVAAALPPLEACQSLIRNARQAGGDDNISVGIFRAIDRAEEPAHPSDHATRRIRVPDSALLDSAADSAQTRQIAIAKRPL